jgi:hypothetical protein
MKRKFQCLSTLGASMAALSIGGGTAESNLGPLAINVKSESSDPEVAVEVVEIKKFCARCNRSEIAFSNQKRIWAVDC